jgi:hypothetical protein
MKFLNEPASGATANTFFVRDDNATTSWTTEVGSSATNANIPNYKSVYIWERTA